MKKIGLVLLLIAFTSAVALPVMAEGIVPESCQGAAAADDCNLGSLKELVINMINFLLAAAGMVALMFLLWGGMQMLLSGGNPEQIKKGKTTLSNALLGLAIVFGSYLIINIVVSQLTGGSIPSFQELLKFW